MASPVLRSSHVRFLRKLSQKCSASQASLLRPSSRAFTTTHFLLRNHPQPSTPDEGGKQSPPTPSTVPKPTCIVTGATSGIGQAIVKSLASKGNNVILIARNAEALSSLQKDLSTQYSSQDFRVLAGDVADTGLWEEVKTKVPKAALLVNAAGVTHTSLLARTELAVIERVLDTNLKGATLGCKYMLGALRKGAADYNNKGTSCIINVSSLLALQGGRGSSVYAASKAGLLGLTRALAAEYGPLRVRVNALLPGYTETPMTTGFNAKEKDYLVSKIPLGRFANPDEIARAAIFLFGNKYANNCVLNLDGGLSASSF